VKIIEGMDTCRILFEEHEKYYNKSLIIFGVDWNILPDNHVAFDREYLNWYIETDDSTFDYEYIDENEVYDVISYIVNEGKKQNYHFYSYKDFYPPSKWELPLEFIKGHMFVRINDGLWLIDTGSPRSFGSIRHLSITTEQFIIEEKYGDISTDILSQYTSISCVGLIGVDVLNNFDFIFEYSQGTITPSIPYFAGNGELFTIEDHMGIPIISICINDITYRMIFDTGSQISYIKNGSLEKYKSTGRFKDFHISVGYFETETFNVPVSFGRETIQLCCGISLPDSIQNILDVASVDGIIGNELLLNHKIYYSPRRKRIYIY